MPIERFNLRVYGILILNDQVLVTDERIRGQEVTKFPGGGLEFGEGTIDCLRREFMEETGQKVEIGSHFYTTDFFQKSAYNESHQIISIYYMVEPTADFEIETAEARFSFLKESGSECIFRWIPLRDISEEEMTLPIDKVVAGLLKEKYS